jgi:hypothetical protein
MRYSKELSIPLLESVFVFVFFFIVGREPVPAGRMSMGALGNRLALSKGATRTRRGLRCWLEVVDDLERAAGSCLRGWSRVRVHIRVSILGFRFLGG